MLPALHAGLARCFGSRAFREPGPGTAVLGARAGAKGGGNAHAERGRVLLPWWHAFRSVAPYLAAPTDPSLAWLPLVTGGLFSCRSRTDSRVRKSHDSRRQCRAGTSAL